MGEPGADDLPSEREGLPERSLAPCREGVAQTWGSGLRFMGTPPSRRQRAHLYSLRSWGRRLAFLETPAGHVSLS